MTKFKNRNLTIHTGSSHGLMRCASCHKPIQLNDRGFATEAYGCYETSEAYVTFHRACSESHPAWAKYDLERATAAEKQRQFQEDCRAFHAKWGVTDFTDEAEEMGLI